MIHTVLPNAGPLFGSFTGSFTTSFTGAVFDGSLTILAAFYVCTAASIDVPATPYILKKGGALFAPNVAPAVLIGVARART